MSDILQRLSDPELVAMRCTGDGWPHGMMSRTLIPDTWVALVITPGGRRRIVPAGDAPRPQSEDTLVLVRNRPIPVALEVTDLPAGDGHPVSGRIELIVRCAARDDDLAALRTTLLGHSELTIGGLTTAIERAGGATLLSDFIRSNPAHELVHDDIRPALLEHLREALRRFLFSAGLTLERIGKVELASTSLARHDKLQRTTARRVQEIEARGVVEQAALTATQRRLGNLGDILSKLKTAAQGDGGTQWHELLPTLTPGERGRLLASLWRLTPDRVTAESIVVVAGYDCVWLDRHQPDQIVQRITLPDDLGGLRSVTFCSVDNALLIGAARGVWRLSAQSGDIAAKYLVPGDHDSRTGFNAAVIGGQRVLATHSQLGAWTWALDDPDDARPLLQPDGGVPKTVRAVTVDEAGRMLLAADNRVRAFDAEGEPLWQSAPAPAAIHCLAPLESYLYVGTSSGVLLRGDLDQPDAWVEVHRAPVAIESIDARRWDDLIELVIPAGRLGVCGVYSGEGIVSRLLEARVSVRRAWACDDLLLGLSDQRDRLIVHGADSPVLDVPVARILGRSIQDACLVTRTLTAQSVAGPAV